jgi:hypothetical protein
LLSISYSFSSETIRKFDTVSVFVDILNPDKVLPANIFSVDLEEVEGFKVVGNHRHTVNAFIQPESTRRETFQVEIGRRFPRIKPRPEACYLSCKVGYTMDYKYYQDKVNIELLVHSALISIIAGALSGSFLGTLIVTKYDCIESYLAALGLKLVVNFTLAFLTVIIFQRKKGVQSFLTIEDFWGGILVGFIVGYSGVQFFNSIIGNTGQTNESSNNTNTTSLPLLELPENNIIPSC